MATNSVKRKGVLLTKSRESKILHPVRDFIDLGSSNFCQHDEDSRKEDVSYSINWKDRSNRKLASQPNLYIVMKRVKAFSSGRRNPS
jgi:hypothetical protein